MAYQIETVEGTRRIEATSGHTNCDGCGAEVRIDSENIAWEKNAHGTWVRHTCPGNGV